MSKSDRNRLSRRGFVKSAAGLPMLLPDANLLGYQEQEEHSINESRKDQSQQPQRLDGEITFTRQSAALQPDKIVDSACQFCNSLCRLKVHMKSGRVIDILGEPDDPVQAGNFCVKGPMMAQLAYNRYRLTTPLKARGRRQRLYRFQIRSHLVGRGTGHYLAKIPCAQRRGRSEDDRE